MSKKTLDTAKDFLLYEKERYMELHDTAYKYLKKHSAIKRKSDPFIYNLMYQTFLSANEKLVDIFKELEEIENNENNNSNS